MVHVPDLRRDLPAAFVLGFLTLATAVAAARRRARQRGSGNSGGAQPSPAQGGRWGALAPSVQKALRAALDGVEGSLVRSLRRTPAATVGGARVVHVVAALERVGGEAGVHHSLTTAIRLLVEGSETLEIMIEATRLRAAQGDDVAQRLAAALGVPVTATRSVERDGTPLLALTVKTVTLTAPAQVRPHPAPLLVPLGATAEGAVIHLNLGRTGGLLVAGGGQSLVATLLASAIYQAPPDALRLLVASDDDELRKALPQLDHLEAPPADARDPRAVAALIAQAHTLVLDRYERYGSPASPSADPPVRLDLLGGTLVYVHDQPITILPRERSLLAALAVLGPRPVPRSDLIEALFADDADGGNTLSHALTDLCAALREAGLPREQARDVVRKSSGGYLLNGDLVAVDLWRFDALLREAEGCDEGEAGPLLAEAFALYHGPLCGGEALNFIEERGYRWMQRVPTALYRLADHCREVGDARAALHWARRLLADEPCDDHANQLALNLLAELGDADGLDAHLAEMREQYKAHKQKMDPYTLRLYEQLRRASEKAG